MTDKLYCSWDEFQEGCNIFAESVNTRFDAVVGLTRGGLIPAVIISHLLDDIPVIAVDYSSQVGRGDNISAHSNDVPQIRGHNLLVVDDIVDSGHTMRELVGLLLGRGHSVSTYAYYWKQGAAFQPACYSVELPEDAPWICFPWE